MNIDVREYLRINPISVLDLSLSSNDNDCFLFFPIENEPRGYIAVTQWQMFNEFYKTIFGELVKFDQQGHPYLDPTGVEPDDMRWQFTKYARRTTVETFMQVFENKLDVIDKNLDNAILTLKRKGVLNYAGATEIQSIKEEYIPALVQYENFQKATGQIWCQTFGSELPQYDLEESLVNQVTRHFHPNTKAETLTVPISRNKLGGEVLGIFTQGNYQLVSQEANRGSPSGTLVHPIKYNPPSTDQLTFPLYGQNILDWRTPGKRHNNVPPCLNVYVKYMNQSSSIGRQALTFPYTTIRQISQSSRDVIVDDQQLQVKKDSLAEAQYQSNMVNELVKYQKENLTPSDCLLRLQIEEEDTIEDNIKMMRQGIGQLLDIFVDVTGRELKGEAGTISDILTPFLDVLLESKQEFNVFYHKMLERIKVIMGKIDLVRQLVDSVKPLTYVGRVVISTTDDTEQKVINHYGGKRWRRIENFLRGVNEDAKLGRRFGEEYVCLRESNVPIHTHDEKLDDNQTTRGQDWLQRDVGGIQAAVVNVKQEPIGAINEYSETNPVKNVKINYQMSPLEYPTSSKITIPHDNMPPHIEVYIWECKEITEEEQELLRASPSRP